MKTGAEIFKELFKMSAAFSNTFNRCSPTVVPGFPPTLVTTVRSFKPSLYESPFTIMMSALALATDKMASGININLVK
jgi:molybdopterin-biosynthesis enzyme MoeA-like protein